MVNVTWGTQLNQQQTVQVILRQHFLQTSQPSFTPPLICVPKRTMPESGEKQVRTNTSAFQGRAHNNKRKHHKHTKLQSFSQLFHNFSCHFTTFPATALRHEMPPLQQLSLHYSIGRDHHSQNNAILLNTHKELHTLFRHSAMVWRCWKNGHTTFMLARRPPCPFLFSFFHTKSLKVSVL